MRLTKKSGALAALLAVLFSFSGCKEEAPKKEALAKAKEAGAPKDKSHDHTGWWCQEHGVPEAICSLCSEEAAAKFKKEGDWCKLHDRAQSQCFKCDPNLYAKYEALYEAKYGKKPPRPPEEEFKK